ncbi:MAG: DUF6496 domain-containing protein [Gemmatimonadota bacterium]
MAAKKGGRRKYGRKAGRSVESAMKRRKRGTLKRGKGGKGGKVKSREQAIAIGLSEAREKGAKVPPPPKKRGRKAAKKAGRKTTKKGARKTTRKGGRK